MERCHCLEGQKGGWYEGDRASLGEFLSLGAGKGAVGNDHPIMEGVVRETMSLTNLSTSWRLVRERSRRFRGEATSQNQSDRVTKEGYLSRRTGYRSCA